VVSSVLSKNLDLLFSSTFFIRSTIEMVLYWIVGHCFVRRADVAGRNVIKEFHLTQMYN